MTNKLSSIALAISSVFFTNTAFAETETSEIEVITVKGDFREKNIQTVASAISLLSQDDIKRRHAQNLEEIIAVAPNVNYAGGSQRARYYQIRGIGERSQFKEPINPSVGIIIDGVDFTGIGSVSSMFDVAQTEIFRGPQGTRFGANALAGMVNITTNAPTDTFEGAVKAMIGNYNSNGLGAVLSGPAADAVSYRVAVEKYQSDGFIENTFLNRDDTNNRDELSVRAKFAIEATDDLAIDVTLMHFDFDNGYDAFSLDTPRETLSDEPGFDTQKTDALAATFNYQGLDAAKVSFITSYSNSDIGYGFDEDWYYGTYEYNWGECVAGAICLPGAITGYSTTDHYFRDKESVTAELRFTSNDTAKLFNNSTSWIIGAYISKQDESLYREYFDWSVLWADTSYTSSFNTKSTSVYGQLETELTDKLVLTTGLRFERRTADYQNSNEVNDSPAENMTGGKVALTYQLSEKSMAYASINRGYKAGGVNTSGSIDESARSFDKETLWNYEFGYKTNFFNDAGYLRVSAFYMDRKNIQLKDYDQIGQEFISKLENANDGYNKGIEVETGLQVNDYLEVYGALGLLKTHLNQYTNGKGEVIAADEQAHAPEHQLALGVNYFATDELLVNLSIENKADYKFSDSHNARSDSYTVVNAAVTYSELDWDISLWARNITDKEYQVRGFYFDNDPRATDDDSDKIYAQLGEPAVFGLTFNYSF
ncbi:MAG: TonB-dependent receptor [Thalassotalea sp.]